MTLFVAGFPGDFDDTDLKEMFELYGEIKSARFVRDKMTRRSKGFGFVEMANKLEAIETMNALNGVTIKGKKILVQKSEDKPNDGFNRQDRPDRDRPDRDRPDNRRFKKW